MTARKQSGEVLTVLVVEDNEAQRSVLVDLMHDEGFRTVACGTAREAYEAVEREEIAVAVVDHRLPDAVGTKLIEQADMQSRGIRAIIHTGYGSFDSARDAVNLGVFAYVEKLGRPEELISHVHRAAQDWLAEALRRREADYQHLLESVQAVVWRSRPDLLHNTFVSHQVEALLGYPAHRWLSEPRFWETHIHPDDRDRVVRQCAEATRSKCSHELEYRMLAADGSVIWVRDLITVIVEDDEPVELVGVMVDVTESKRIEEALRASQAHLHAVVESEPECVKVVDREGRLKEMNAAGLAMLEADTLDQIAGQPAWTLVLPAYQAAYRALHDRVMQGEQGMLEIKIEGLRGTQRWLEMHSAPLLDARGEIDGHLSVTRDITAHREAEAAIRASEAHLVQAQHIANLGSWEHDLIDDTVHWSAQTYVIFGCDPAVTTPSFDLVCQAVHPEDRDAFKGRRESSLDGAGPYGQQYRIIRPDGDVRTIWQFAEIACDEDGHPVRLFGTVQDITEQERMRTALRVSEERLEVILKSLDDVVWSMDVRTGELTYISPAAEALYGHPAEAFQEDPDLWKRVIHPDDRDRVLSESALEAGDGKCDLEYRIVRPDGTVRWVHDRSHLAFDDEGTPRLRNGIVSNVTERREAQRLMQESAARNRALVHAIPDAMFRINREGVYLDYLRAEGFETLLPPEQFLGLTVCETLPASVSDPIMHCIEQALLTGNLQRHEYMLEQGGERLYFEARIVPHGETDVLAVVRDDTERCRMEEALREQEARNRMILQTTLDGYLLADTEGRILDTNPAYCAALGYTREELLQLSIADLEASLSPEQLASSIEQIISSGSERFETKHRHKQGHVIDLEVSLSVLMIRGTPLVAAFVRDVTDRNRANAALRLSESRFRAIVEHAPIGIFQTDAAGDNVYTNAVMQRQMGLTREESLGSTFRKAIHPEDLEEVAASFGEAVEARAPIQRELRYVHEDGTVVWAQGIAAPLFDGDTLLGYVGMVTDVTERVHADAALRRSEERYRLLTEFASEAIVVLDVETGHFVDANSNGEALFGLAREALLQTGPAALSPPLQSDGRPSEEGARDYIQQAVAGGICAFEWIHRRSDGTDIPCEIRLVRLPHPDRVLVRASITDITERKAAERIMRESETRLELALEGGNLGLWDWDVRTGSAVFNERWAEMLGYRLDEIEQRIDAWEKLVHPDDLMAVIPILETHFRGDTPYYEAEHRMRTKQGGWRWILDRGKVVERAPDGTALRAAGTHLDITERKQIEEALRASREKFAKAFRASPDSITITRLRDGLFLEANDGFERMTGYSRDEAIGKLTSELNLWQFDDRASFVALLSQEGGLRDYEVRVGMRMGEMLDCEVSAEVIELDGEQCLVAITRDVTEHKRAEAALRASEESFRLMFANNPIPMWVFDQQTLAFLDVNQAAVDHYGYRTEEFLGMTIRDIRPEEDLQRFTEYFDQPLPTTTGPEEWRHRLSDGRIIDVEITAHSFSYQGRTARLILANDITERKQLQREILEISNREQRRIGQDLHDGLGQLLTGIGFRVEELVGDLRRDGLPLAEETVELGALVEAAISQARSLARGLNPVNVERQGLAVALGELAGMTAHIYGIPCTFVCPKPVRIVDLDAATHLYRIAQEALNNASKHARASHLEVRLQQFKDAITLTVRDDGIGMPAHAASSTGMGLRIMAYRARMIGGYFDFHDAPGGGTIVRCRYYPVPSTQSIPSS